MKRILLVLAGLMISSGAYAQGPSFVSGGKLAACVDPTFPPMEFVDTPGQPPVGVDVDVIDALAKEWNVKAATTTMDFSGLLPGLESKRCDIVISGALLKQERLQKFSAVPYLKTDIVMIGKGDNKDSFKSYDDFSGKVVAVQAGTSYVGVLQKVNEQLKKEGKPEITLQTYPKQTDCIQQVMVGRAVATISQDTEYAYRELKSPGTLKILYSAGNEDEYAAYFRKSEDDQKAVQAAVKSLLDDGTLNKIAAKWHMPASAVDKLKQ